MWGMLHRLMGWLMSLFSPVLGANGDRREIPKQVGSEMPAGARTSDDVVHCKDQGLRHESPAGPLCDASPLSNTFWERVDQKWRYLAFGERPEPVPSHRGPVEKPHPGKTGICCSGGGIRSAAYNLGALQALQECSQKELQNAHYLAAVSGGSYICAAYSMVGKRWGEKGTKRPHDNPRKPYNGYDDSNPDLFEELPPFARNSPEEQYLRNRSSYMAPDGMAKIFLGIRVLLGLVFNLVFLALPIAVVMIVLGLLIYAPSLGGLLSPCSGKCGFHPTSAWWLPPVILAGLGLIVAASRVARRPKSDRSLKVTEVWSARLLVFAAIVALMTLALPAVVGAFRHAFSSSAGGATPTAAVGGGAGFAGLVAGVVAFFRDAIASPAHVVKEVGAARTRLMKLNARIRTALIHLAGAVAGPLLLFATGAFALSVTLANYGSHRTELWISAGVGAVLFGAFYLAADLTSWSLHPFYKRRLCTAFALKRVSPAEVSERRVKAGIPQEKEAGIAVEREYDRLVPLSKTALKKWPALIVCAAANISDPGATPPGRRVTSFTFSANTVGGPLVGAMKTKHYERAFGENRQRDFSLPATVAVSGAAIAPSMGKVTQPSFRFLLALANIRLGVWLPNPRWVVRTTRRQRRFFGRPRPSYLIRELLGRNRVDGKYLYVTDGGHYEDLGLVELLRRGCTRVFCFDASGGQKFSELGDAVALARSELGIKIEIDPTPLDPKGNPPIAKRATTTGWIHYPTGDKGRLVYSRNVMSPGGPWDVRAHQLDDARFPHDSTVDQLYTDQKFESYRALGAEAGRHAAARMNELAPRTDGPLVVPDKEGEDRPDGALAPHWVREMLQTATIQLVDLREDFAYDRARIQGATHVKRSIAEKKKRDFLKKYPVVFYCGEGFESPEVASAFRDADFTAFYIEGGIRRWIDDGLPIDGETTRSAPSTASAKSGANGLLE